MTAAESVGSKVRPRDEKTDLIPAESRQAASPNPVLATIQNDRGISMLIRIVRRALTETGRSVSAITIGVEIVVRVFVSCRIKELERESRMKRRRG